MAYRKGRCLRRKNGRCLKRAKNRRPAGRRKGHRRHRKPAGMARRGSKCVRFKRVRVRGGGMQRRCASYRR